MYTRISFCEINILLPLFMGGLGTGSVGVSTTGNATGDTATLNQLNQGKASPKYTARIKCNYQTFQNASAACL